MRRLKQKFSDMFIQESENLTNVILSFGASLYLAIDRPFEQFHSEENDSSSGIPTDSLLHLSSLLLMMPLRILWGFLRGAWLYLRAAYLTFHQPGPRGLPLFGVVLFVERNNAAIHKYAVKKWRETGSYSNFFVGPLLVVFSNIPRDLEMVLSSFKFLSKGILYRFLHDWLRTGLLTSTEEKWRARRKILTPAFHFKILEQFLPVMLSNSDIFVQQLRKRAGAASFDVFPLCSLLTLDVICETAMGVKVNAQLDSESRYVRAVKDMANAVIMRGLMPWLYPDVMFRWSALGRKHKEALDVLHGTTSRVITERRNELQKLRESGTPLDSDVLGRRRRVAFLDLLLLAETADGGGALSDTDIREEVDTFMFEGHDTTASGLAFTLFLLSQHPDVQEKLLAELESLFDQTLRPTPQDLGELVYLEMVIKEALRLYPPVAVFARHIEGDTPLPSGDRLMPANSTLLVSPFTLHRDPEVYPDPETFNPERFRPENCVGRHPYAYLPFSAGPRNCIGQRFAMMELKSAVAKAVWSFRLLPEPGFKPKLTWELILKSDNGLFLRLEERERLLY